jgi:hypothetical protein
MNSESEVAQSESTVKPVNEPALQVEVPAEVSQVLEALENKQVELPVDKQMDPKLPASEQKVDHVCKCEKCDKIREQKDNMPKNVTFVDDLHDDDVEVDLTSQVVEERKASKKRRKNILIGVGFVTVLAAATALGFYFGKLKLPTSLAKK